MSPNTGMSGTYQPHQMDGVASVRIKRGITLIEGRPSSKATW